jgi:hypothetical protein
MKGEVICEVMSRTGMYSNYIKDTAVGEKVRRMKEYGEGSAANGGLARLRPLAVLILRRLDRNLCDSIFNMIQFESV